ncbi:hypothetical protein [Chitinophaga deserti]|uniref:hypothetical protein n=1 Tax=Chitinophaga deserti TaxID=2164099 RepID=UPI000D6CFB07|nr:hypothetical protein [Chitinophaga deserti]
MWSVHCWYFAIRANQHFTVAHPTATIIELLNSKNLFIQTGSHTFKEKPGQPWVNIKCIYTKNGNFGTPESLENKLCTLLYIQATKTLPDSIHYFRELLTPIARELNWEFILECDDEENEDVVLYRLNDR